MEKLKVSISAKNGVSLPEYATNLSSGVDLKAFIEEPISLKPMQRALVPTGLFIGIPEGYEAEVRPRSGMAIKYGVTVLNTPGTIDADYRGEVGVILVNMGDEPFTINNGDRIAQMVFKRVEHVEWVAVDALSETSRGHGGFGSTGK
ncbi:MAG TPA: dUTP diphosphatase [Syntrophorhabdaceae bacterium]|nr:dUTP diphosphatase [Syntrophorhabdaceae bacterium]